jgi:aspartate 1-decarboxylase
MKEILHAKIHHAIVTESNLNYVGSITVDEALLEKVGIVENEKVLVSSITSGNILETYVFLGKRNSGVICMNGATSHLIKKGEIVVIMAFEITNDLIKPKVALVDNNNAFIKYL